MIEEGAEATEEESLQREHCVKSLVSPGQVIALYTDDSTANFYLMKVTRPLSITTSSVTDTWGTSLPKGTEIFEGLYYDLEHGFSYKLIPNRRAVVPAAALVYVCAEIEASSSIILPKSLYVDIMSTVAESIK